MKRLLAALRFLTVFPIPGTWGTGEEELVGCVPWFPVVGVILGALAGAVAWGLSLVAPPMVSAIVLIVLLLRLSGGLHMDGLADTADGFYSSRKRERILEIMKDSRVGPMGVIAVVCLLLGKFAGLSSMPREQLWRTAAMMPLAGRCLMVVQMAALPYARQEGLGLLFYKKSHRLHALWAMLVLAGGGWLLLGWQGLLAAGCCLLVTAIFSHQCRQKIQGATGDTFGALCEMGEATVALVLACRW